MVVLSMMVFGWKNMVFLAVFEGILFWWLTLEWALGVRLVIRQYFPSRLLLIFLPISDYYLHPHSHSKSHKDFH